jgi:hypothetical protein
MITRYRSASAAAEASASMRPHLGSVIGPLVSGPPLRWAGPVVVSAGDTGDKELQRDAGSDVAQSAGNQQLTALSEPRPAVGRGVPAPPEP